MKKNHIILVAFLFCKISVFSQPVELSVQTGHTSSIRNISFSTDGQFLASADDNNKVNIWHVPTGGQMAEIYSSKDYGKINILSFSPRNELLLISTEKNILIIWDITKSEEICHFPLAFSINFICFGSEPEFCFLGSDKIYSLNIPERKIDIFLDKSIYLITYSKESGNFIVLFANGEVNEINSKNEVIKDYSNNHISKVFQRKYFSGNEFKIDLTNNQILFLRFNLIKGLSLKDGKRTFNISSDYIDEAFNSIAISIKNNLLAAANGDGKIYTVRLTDGKNLKKLRGHLSNVNDIVFSPDESIFASCSKDRSILIWDSKTLKIIKRLYSRAFPITCINKSSDEKMIVFGNEIGFTRTLNIETILLNLNSVKNHANEVSDVSYLSGDSIIVSCGYDNRVCWLKNEPLYLEKKVTFKKIFALKIILQSTLQKLGFYTEPYFKADSILISADQQSFTVFGGKTKKVNKKRSNDQNVLENFITLDFNKSFKNSGKGKPLENSILLPKSHLENSLIANGFDFYNPQFGHSEKITGITEIEKYNLVVTSSMDATIKFWSLNSKKLILTIIPIDRDKKILITADHFYLAPREALSAIGFKYGNEYFPSEQFDIQFNRPDKVHEVLGIASPDLIQAYYYAYLKRLKKMNFSENMIGSDLHLPEVEIPDKQLIPISTDQKSIYFKTIVTDNKYLIDRANIFINDVPVYGVSGIDLRKENTDSIQLDLKLDLAQGKNKVQVSVMNMKGVESLKETFVIDCKSEVKIADLYLVCIGTSQYKDSRFNLNYAAKDAADISALFGGKNDVFNEVHIKTLKNSEVTKDNILKVKEFLNQAGRNDVVILFVAGHGLLDESFNYYYGTSDIDFNNPSINGISYDELGSLLDGLSALKKLLFMDTCHSGEVDKDEVEFTQDIPVSSGNITFRASGSGVRMKEGFGLNNTNELTKEMFSDLRKGTGSTVVSSSGGAEYSMESKNWNNGLFTFCLIEGLKSGKADLNKDKKIMVSELQEYVRKRATEISGGRQVPTSRTENISTDFRIW